MSEPDVSKRPRGRPRSEPGGRGGTLTITINPHTRAYLEKAGADLARSLSQTAELAIERGRLIGELGEAGPAVADALQSMVKAAVEVRETYGEPTASVYARDELRNRWVEVAKGALPNVHEPLSGQLAAISVMSALNYTALDALSMVLRADPADQRLAALRAPLRQLFEAQSDPSCDDWPAIIQAVQDAGDHAPKQLRDCLNVLLHLAETAVLAQARAAQS